MPMFRKFITIGLLLLCPALAQADIVSQLEQAYQHSKGIEAHFQQQTHIEIMDRDEIRSGILYFTQNKFRIAYAKPYKQIYIFNGETLWIYSPRFKEVEVFTKAVDRISKEALAFLSGLGTLRQKFRITKIKQTENRAELTLIPKSKSSMFSKIILTVEEPSLQVLQAQLWPKQGNQTRYTFSKFKADTLLKNKLFEFKTPKGVTVRNPEF